MSLLNIVTICKVMVRILRIVGKLKLFFILLFILLNYLLDFFLIGRQFLCGLPGMYVTAADWKKWRPITVMKVKRLETGTLLNSLTCFRVT